jgi:hypothetical protein
VTMLRQKLTKEIVNTRLFQRGITMLDEYVHQTIKARFRCSQGHVWSARPNNVLSGKGCPECKKVSLSNKKRLDLDEVHKRLEKQGISLIGEYAGSNAKTLFQCSRGHSWETVPAVLFRGGGCPICYEKNQPLTKEMVNSRIEDRGIIMLGEYLGAHNSTLFQCNKGHTWLARPANILNIRRGCPHCANQFPLSKEIVNERIAHRGLSLIGKYTNTVSTSIFQCSEGHSWEASPGNVMFGTGCPICAGNTQLTTEIVNDRIADRGIVLLDEYINNSSKRRFQCNEGHIWKTAPAGVLSGTGCPICAERFSDNDVFYLWIAGVQEHVLLERGEFLVKFGVTSERRDDLRIKEIGWKWGTSPNVIAIVKTQGPAHWAEKACQVIGKPLSSDLSHLDGWTEFRIVSDTELAQLMDIADQAAGHKIFWNNPVPHIKKYHHDQLKLEF